MCDTMSESAEIMENESIQDYKQNDVDNICQLRAKVEPSNGNCLNNTNGNLSGSGEDSKRRKRRKTRRGKPKRGKLKPYSKLSWQDRRAQDDKASNRAYNRRAKMLAHGQPVAPYNTTQFLMADHNDLENIDERLEAVASADKIDDTTSSYPPRIRDSSLSVDSEDDYFYSSPEDEGEFLTREFSSVYNDLHAERLNSLGRPQLIQEVLQVEEKYELQRKEMSKLKLENERLRRENEHLRRITKNVSVSSVDSESDSTTPCSSGTGSESEDDTSKEIENMEKDRTCNDKLPGTDCDCKDKVSGNESDTV